MEGLGTRSKLFNSRKLSMSLKQIRQMSSSSWSDLRSFACMDISQNTNSHFFWHFLWSRITRKQNKPQGKFLRKAIPHSNADPTNTKTKWKMEMKEILEREEEIEWIRGLSIIISVTTIVVSTGWSSSFSNWSGRSRMHWRRNCVEIISLRLPRIPSSTHWCSSCNPWGFKSIQ